MLVAVVEVLVFVVFLTNLFSPVLVGQCQCTIPGLEITDFHVEYSCHASKADTAELKESDLPYAGRGDFPGDPSGARCTK